ncbi:MAG: NAD(+)/NADH kinase [Thermoleophilaceae bacterium]
MNPPRRVVLHSHHRVADTAEAVQQVVAALRDAGAEVVVSRDEADKQGLDGVTVVDDTVATEPDLAVVLGGDGTMLAALRDYAQTDTVVFAFNFGAVGFLATVDRDAIGDGVRRLVNGDYDVLALPTLVIEPAVGRRIAVNDVTFLRRSGARVAQLAYLVADEPLAQARCDGLVVSTAVGSTGYNLANGGPIMAWGVEGYVVSFIAPHTLTARTLVAATSDVLVVRNLSLEESVDVETDGRRVCKLEPGQDLEVRFEDRPARLAKLPGTGFYDQLREKFGPLAG